MCPWAERMRICVSPESSALSANVCPVLGDLSNWRRHVTGSIVQRICAEIKLSLTAGTSEVQALSISA
jgi:hypothetical protein